MWFCHDETRLAGFRAWFEHQVNDIVLLAERGHLCAVIVLQIVPRPTGAKRRPAKIAFVADQVAFDSLNARRDQRGRGGSKRFAVIAAVELPALRKAELARFCRGVLWRKGTS